MYNNNVVREPPFVMNGTANRLVSVQEWTIELCNTHTHTHELDAVDQIDCRVELTKFLSFRPVISESAVHQGTLATGPKQSPV